MPNDIFTDPNISSHNRVRLLLRIILEYAIVRVQRHSSLIELIITRALPLPSNYSVGYCMKSMHQIHTTNNDQY